MIHNFIVQTEDNTWIESLYGKTPATNEKIRVEEQLTLEYLDTKDIGKGFGATELAINIMVTVFVGIPVNLVAALIYDKLMNGGKNIIVNKEEKVTLVTKEDVIKYLEKCSDNKE